MSEEDCTRASLATLIGDLSPTSNTGSDQLASVVQRSIEAIQTGQDVTPSARSLSTAQHQLVDQLLSQPKPAQIPTTRILRQNLVSGITTDPTLISQSTQKPTAQFGPFLDELGRLVSITAVTAIPLIAIQWTGATSPFLYLGISPPTGTSNTISFGASSVWIPASQLIPGQPATLYAGLNVQGGTLSLPAAVNVAANPITIPTTGNVTLKLTLAQPTPLPPTPPVHGSPSFKVPVTATFSFRATSTPNAVLLAADSASVSAWGNSVSLSGPTGGPASAMTLPASVQFPYNFSPNSFNITNSDSQLVAFAGTAKISGAAWIIPFTTATASSSLPAAANAGGISLSLDAGLTVTQLSTNLKIDCGPSSVVVLSNYLALLGTHGIALGVTQPISIGNNSVVTAQTAAPFTWEYLSLSTGTDGLALQPPLAITLDQPRTINNERVRLAGSGFLIYTIDSQGNGALLLSSAAATNDRLPPTQSYALKNLLLGGTPPSRITGNFTLDNGSIKTGSYNTTFTLRFAIPFLPDPYTVNFPNVPATPSTGNLGTVDVTVNIVGNQEPTVKITPASAQTQSLITPEITQSEAVRISAPVLLDLSTNISQFGVALTSDSRDRVTTPNIQIADLLYQSPASAVAVLTLPAIQWEPVVSPNPTLLPDGKTPFPSPLSYPDSGQPTALRTQSTTLIPVAPRQAIDNLVSSYNASPSSNVTATFTLPFGITATANLAKTPLISVSPPGLNQVQPNFSASNLSGGDQLSLTGQYTRFIIGRQAPSPYFPGSAVQTATALSNGTATTVTVLTTPAADFTPTFNTQFKDFVPLTRFDISGFGASVFSDWRDVKDDGTYISKVQFDVMVGRTGLEVVQIVSTIYPFAIRVVRTITMERINSGIVVRRDSGWQAASDGVYAFPNAAIVTHPGVVKGVRQVINIRDLGQQVSVASNTISLSAVAFDCAVTMEGVTLGQSANGVPAKNLIGYVQTTFGSGLTPDQYAELLGKVGSLGGAIDCNINIGGSNQIMRVSQIGVGASQGTTGNEFVMAAWGSPIFPTGEWSFIVVKPGSTIPAAIPSGTGVPLIRAGPAPQTPPVTNPYRFADPADLLPASSSTAYILCFSMGTSRLGFLRPKIEAQAPWAFTSTLPPRLADPYALGTTPSTAPFPALALCIPFNDNSFSIVISAKGDLKLQLPSPSFTTAVTRRVLLQSDTATSVAQTGDENKPPNPSVVTIAIDSTAQPRWSLSITNLSYIAEVPSMATDASDPTTGEVTRSVGTMTSSQGTTAVFATPRLVFGPAMKPLKDAMSFFEQFGIVPAPQVSMRNDWELEEKVTIKLADFLKAIFPAGGLLEKILDDLDFTFLIHGDGTLAYVEVEMELTLKIPLAGVFSYVFLGKFNYHVGTDGKSFLLTLGAGVGAEIEVGPFTAKASIVATILGLIADHSWGVGAGVIIKAGIDLLVIEVETEFEARFMYLETSCGSPQGTTKWGLTQLEIAFDVHIFLVLDISYHTSGEWKTNFNGGPCPMDVAGLTENVGKPS